MAKVERFTAQLEAPRCVSGGTFIWNCCVSEAADTHTHAQVIGRNSLLRSGFSTKRHPNPSVAILESAPRDVTSVVTRGLVPFPLSHPASKNIQQSVGFIKNHYEAFLQGGCKPRANCAAPLEIFHLGLARLFLEISFCFLFEKHKGSQMNFLCFFFFCPSFVANGVKGQKSELSRNSR